MQYRSSTPITFIALRAIYFMHAVLDVKNYQMLPISRLSEQWILMYVKDASNIGTGWNPEMHRLTEIASRLLRKRRERSEGGPIGISPDVIASAHPDGVVFLHIGKGAVFNSNRIGARIWRGLTDREPLGAVTAAIAREYGVQPEQVERDAAEFLTDLEARGFLTRGGGL